MWLKRKIYSYYLRDEEDGEGEGGGGEGGGKGDDAGAARLANIEKALGVLANANASFQEGLTALTSKLEQLGQAQPPKNQGSSGGGEDEDVDLETMDRKTFAAYMARQMRGIVEDSLKPVKEGFGKLDEKIDATSLAGMIKEFQKDHPDFYEWKEEMRGILRESPTLTPARAYALARTENPEKAKKIDEKYGLGKPEKKSAEENFLGLFPTSGSGSSATKGAGRMKPQAAAEAAWTEVMSKMNG